MIVSEYMNDSTLIKHYSDAGVLLRQEETGELYADPIDVVPCPYTYTETNEPIEEPEEMTEIEEKAMGYDILTGVIK